MAKKIYTQDTPVKLFTDAQKAYDYIKEIYDTNTDFLREKFIEFSAGKDFKERVHVYYPYLEIRTESRDYRRWALILW